MGCGRLILAVLFPPLAVLDKGWRPVLVVALLTIFGWIPGIIGAIALGAPED